jgi:hypothetical protein
MIATLGMRPLNEPLRAYPIFHCERCFAPVIHAWDDEYPLDDSEIFKRTINLEQLPPAKGHVVLWYQLDVQGRPIGRQMFQRWDPRSEYMGPTWVFHYSTCTGKGSLHGSR